MIKPTGWNTWDVAHLNALVHLPSQLRARFSLFNPDTLVRKDIFDWRTGMHRLGPHASDGSYSQIDLRWDEVVVSYEFAQPGSADGSSILIRLKFSDDSAPGPVSLLLLVELDGAWGRPVQVEAVGEGLRAVVGSQTWGLIADRPPLRPLPEILSSGPPLLAYPLARGMGESGAPNQSLILYIVPSAEKTAVPGDAGSRIDGCRMRYLDSCLRSAGWLEDAAAGMTRGLHWNTIWEPVKARICSPASRDWCRDPAWGGYVLFDWDTFFAAMMSALEDPALAEANIRAILQEITPAGFVPNFGSARSQSLDRSQPPVGAYVVLKYLGSRSLVSDPGAASLMAELFPLLLGWHRWWMPHRDGNGDGLLEWGSDPQQASMTWGSGSLREAMYESGLDNSPMYDEAIYNELSHTMELADVGLNALYALDAWALAEMARLLGMTGIAGDLLAEYQQMARLINQELWNESAGIYQNKFWDGRFSSSLSPTNFYPLIAGVAPYDRARRMVSAHLLNQKKFWGGFVLPSISRSDPGYRGGENAREGLKGTTNHYWRGRIWGPMNFLVCEGLRRYRFDSESYALSRRSLDLFLAEWRGESHIHENYDDISGDGDDASNSDPVYHWGGLLAYLGMQELADYEPWSGWRFGNLGDGFAVLRGVVLNEGCLDVAISPAGLRVSVNGSLLLDTDQTSILRSLKMGEGEISANLHTEAGEVVLTLHGLPPNKSVQETINGTETTGRTTADGQLALHLADRATFKVNW